MNNECNGKAKKQQEHSKRRCLKPKAPKRVNKVEVLSQFTRRPVCFLCHVRFTDVRLFEHHLNSGEHKLKDAPLACILNKLEKSNCNEPHEYKMLRSLANGEQPGADCISQIQAYYCGICNTYIPHVEGQQGIEAHLKSAEHLTRMTTTE